jgi:thioredoxin reductase (NADPH)
MIEQDCEHLEKAKIRRSGVVPSGHGCKECLELGDDWVHLRLCLSCGHVGCCDNSKNKHATKHFRHAKHPVIRSFEPGEDWGYCFIDDTMVETLPAHPGESAPVHYEAP